MRTTIELKDDLRARLLEMAATRGEKGFSGLVNEAVESYLAGLAAREQARQRALETLGSLTAEEAGDMRRTIGQLRETWR